MREFTKIKITPKGERSVKHGHPWVFGDEVSSACIDYR